MIPDDRHDLPPVPRPPTREQEMEAKAFPAAPIEQERAETRLAELRHTLAVLKDVRSRVQAWSASGPTKRDLWYDAWRDAYDETEYSIGLETRRAGGNRDEV